MEINIDSNDVAKDPLAFLERVVEILKDAEENSLAEEIEETVLYQQLARVQRDRTVGSGIMKGATIRTY